ncbi:MAG: 2-C-methyl-D-erythritol 4-phosphate cytidylyltransferase [Melioribacteraceae bacterium]|nr:2-C-methyl-D-erythritol 4-phosphate cytidylyltransferase [Melioribacteraceae bacterium]
MSKVYAIIPAGGSGKRIGSELPKQFIQFDGKEMIAYTLDVFQKCDLIDEIIIATQQKFFDTIESIKSNFNLDKITKIVEGGKERQESVFNALSSIDSEDNDFIVVHDAARPLLPQDVLTNSIKLAHEKGNSVAAIKAKDTLIKGSNKVDIYIDRQNIYYVQTPQIFMYKELLEAMRKAANENFTGTDESMLVKRLGKEIFIAEGSSLNFKVTAESDLELFRKLVT